MLLMLISALITPLTLSLGWSLLVILRPTILGRTAIPTLPALELTTILLLLVAVPLTCLILVVSAATLLVLLRRRGLVRVVLVRRRCLVARVVVLLRGLVMLRRGVVLVLRRLVLVLILASLVLVIGIDISPCVRTAGAEALLPWLSVSLNKYMKNQLTILPPIRSWAELRILAPGYRVSNRTVDKEWTYHRDVVRSKYTLQTPTERSVIMFSTTSIGIVAQSLVLVVSYRIRSQSVQNLLLVSTTPIEPASHFVEHHSLDLG
jgi:hypothetical protein